MVNKIGVISCLGLAITFSGCTSSGSRDYGNFGSPYATQQQQPAPVDQQNPYGQQPYQQSQNAAVSDDRVVLGKPYQINGKTYTPENEPLYDEAGYASWYGAELAGRQTANGETFNPSGASATHRTLPLPSYVEVTNLDNGRTILVRVNDRGPFETNRLIDLSYGAAQQLGIVEQGLAAVRVRRVNPPEPEKAALREGRLAAPRLDTPDSLLLILKDRLKDQPVPPRHAGQAPGGSTGYAAASPTAIPPPSVPAQGNDVIASPTTRPQASIGGRGDPQSAGADYARPQTAPAIRNSPEPSTAVRPAATSGYVVQLGAFSSASRAQALAKQTGAHIEKQGNLFKVRYGPYSSRAAAQQGISKARGHGITVAKIMSAK